MTERGHSFSIASQASHKYADKERGMGIAVSESAYKDLSFAGGIARSRNKGAKSSHHLLESNIRLKILLLDPVPRNSNMKQR